MAVAAARRQRDPPPHRLTLLPPKLAGIAARLVRGVLLLAVTLLAAAPFAVLAALWRLDQGPVDLDGAAGRLAPGLAATLAGPDARLDLGHATLQWRGFSEGPGAGLELRLQSATLSAAGRPVVAAGPTVATLHPGTLLQGEPVSAAVDMDSLDVHLAHDGHGLRLQGMPPADTTPPTSAPELADRLPDWLLRLRTLHLGTATVTLADSALGTATLHLDGLALRGGDGLHGTASGTLALGAASAAFTLSAERSPDGEALVQLTVAPTPTAPLAAVLPGLLAGQTDTPLPDDVLDAPVSAQASLRLSPDAQPRSLSLQLFAGPGQVRVADKRIRFTEAAVAATATWSKTVWSRPDRLIVSAARAVLPAPGGGPATTLTARLEAEGAATLAGTAELALDRVAFADLGALWPTAAAPHVRPWLTQNITAGTARDAALRLGFEAPSDLSAFHLRTVVGRLTGDDLTVHWLRPVPPIEHATALLTIEAPDQLDIAVPAGLQAGPAGLQAGRQGGIALRHGNVHITGLNVKDQFLAVRVDLAGAVPELLGLLGNPRLNLLNRHPLPMRDPAGAFDGHLAVDLPLNHDLRFEQVAIATSTRFTGLHLGGLVAGRDLDRGDVRLDATVDGLHAAGQARIAGIPSRLSVAMDFRSGPPGQVVQSAQVQARATAPQLAAAGLDPGPVMEAGTLAIAAQYEEHRDGAARLHAAVDAAAAGLSVAGWRKPPGRAAAMSATVLLNHGRLSGIEEVHASGPGMLLDAAIHPVDGRPLDLELRRLVLGRTEAAGSLRLPAKPGDAMVARLSGPTLDLSSQFGPDPAHAAPQQPRTRDDGAEKGPGTPIVADIRFDRVLLARGGSVSGVAGHAEYDGRRLTALHAVTGAPEYVQADIRREGTGRRATIRAADAGAALRALDVTDTIRGGVLQAEGVFDDRLPRSPLSGQAQLTGFHVGKGVVIGKLLQALTLYGVPDALSGPGVLFDRLLLPFRWDGSVLAVSGARAFSASLGLTAEGTMDNRRDMLDLRGTVVPAYVLNSLLGRIPGIGRLFSPERGGGLVALDWSLRGPIDDPALHVNPLSLLTPGILRNVFK